ncbi:MAG TPA: hypothetical protein VMA55_18900 [Acidovorax sp.]|nr:hypothetical protein [Acidovorax sp.]
MNTDAIDLDAMDACLLQAALLEPKTAVHWPLWKIVLGRIYAWL